MVAATSSLSPLTGVERRLEKILRAGDPVAFAPVLPIALVPTRRLRAMLALTASRCVGIPEGVARELAVTIEILHLSSLVPVANNALHALAWKTLLELDAIDAARLLARTLERMAVGQAGALLGFAASAAATMVRHRGANRLQQFGEELGVALELLGDNGAELAHRQLASAHELIDAAAPLLDPEALHTCTDLIVARWSEGAQR